MKKGVLYFQSFPASHPTTTESIDISGDTDETHVTVKELVEGQFALPLALLSPLLFTATVSG